MEVPKMGGQTSPQNLYDKKESLRLSVSEKIFNAQYETPSEKTGPVLELFFHELTNKETKAQRIFDLFFCLIVSFLLLLLYPFIALGIKISSRGPIISKIKTEGKSGHLFSRLEFRTAHPFPNKPVSSAQNSTFAFGNFLFKSGLYKLPTIINIFKKEMSVVGPMAYNQKESSYWNYKLDDFYKRHAVKPGLISIYHVNEEDRELPAIKKQLKKEFKYIVAPSLTYDLKVLVGNF